MPLAEVSATSLLEGFPEPMLVIRVDGTVVFTNSAAAASIAPAHDFVNILTSTSSFNDWLVTFFKTL